MKRKSLLFLPLVAIATFMSASLLKDVNYVKTDAAYLTKNVFEDVFDSVELNQDWESTGSVSLNQHYSSMRLKPTAYDWSASLNLNRNFNGSFKVRIDLKTFSLGGWFAVSFGNANAGAPFTSSKGGFVFFDNNYFQVLDIREGELKALDIDIDKMNYVSPFTTVENVRRIVEITVTEVDYETSLIQCEVYENGLSIGTCLKTPYTAKNLNGYIGFNSMLKSVEIYSVEVLDSSNTRLYYDDFSTSSILYPSSGSISAEWYSNGFNEDVLKIGYVNSLYLENIDSGVTYFDPLVNVDNRNVSVAYKLETEIQYSSMSFDVEAGFEIAKESKNSRGLFFGLRREPIGYSIVYYAPTSTEETKLSSLNEPSNMTVQMTLSIYQDCSVEFECGDIKLNVDVSNYDGYVGLFTRTRVSGSNTIAGASFNSFVLDKCNYYQRDSRDMYNNFNGVKEEYFEATDEYVKDYFVSKKDWNIGTNVSSSAYNPEDQGNGKMEFNISTGTSFFGPKVIYNDFIVRFDVEILNEDVPYGGTLGLQFGSSRPGIMYDNSKTLGLGNYHNAENGNAFATFPAVTNMKFAPGASQSFTNANGEVVNIFKQYQKFTLMFVGRNNMVSLYYLLDGEDESTFRKVRTTVMCKDNESIDGYLAVFGANGISFAIDNLSVINLDLDAPVTSYIGKSNYQEVTRIDLSTSSNLGGLTATSGEHLNNKYRLSSNGELNTSKLTNDFILRLKVKDIENTMSIVQDSLSVNFVNTGSKRIEVNNEAHPLGDDFDFFNSTIELEKMGASLKIRITGNGTPLSLFEESVFSVDIPQTSDSVLTVKSVNGYTDLLTYTFINMNRYVTIATRDYNPEADDFDPWIVKPTKDDGKKSGCAGDASSSSLIILAISAIGLLTVSVVRRRAK